jgi:Tfp pilus assembly protein PilF
MAIHRLICIVFAAATLLSGCASVGVAPLPPPAEFFRDTAFAPPTEAIGAADLFTLSPAMRAYLKSPEFAHRTHIDGPERGLVNALYKKGELKLEYDSAKTRNAAQTYAARSGNCLSMVIMTAAFARELGLNVRYNNVMVDEAWSRHGGLYVASTHVNLSLGRRGERDAMTIDFLPPEDVAGYHSYQLNEEEVVALYLNNRAAEALTSDRINDAYWWARAAVLQHPASVNAWNTLAVIYRQHGELALAERVFAAALQREPENTILMHNLVPLLAANGKVAESKALAARLASLEPVAPFHYFTQGIKAMERSDFAQARDLFAREVKRAPYYHEFHFWLAIAHLRLGETTAAKTEIRLALDTSTTREASELYAAKLAHLRGAATRLPASF